MSSTISNPFEAKPELNYRSMSVLAIVGCVLGLFSVSILAWDSMWILIIISLPAIVVSAVARRQIRNSDGTLTGEMLAMLGLILSVGCAIAWITRIVTISYITEAEARNVADSFFEHLRKNDPGMAFLLTKPPQMRDTIQIDTSDLRKMSARFQTTGGSEFDQFMAISYLQSILRNGKENTISFDVKSQTDKIKDDYLYTFAYKISNPSLEGRLFLKLISEQYDTPAGRTRGWTIRIDSERSEGYLMATRFGSELHDAIRSLQLFVNAAVMNIGDGELEELKKVLAPEFANSTTYNLVISKLRPINYAPDFVVPINPPKFLRVESESRNGKQWTIKQVISVKAYNDLEVELEVTVRTEDYTLADARSGEQSSASSSKWKLIEWKFLGERKFIPEEMKSVIRGVGSGTDLK